LIFFPDYFVRILQHAEKNNETIPIAIGQHDFKIGYSLLVVGYSPLCSLTPGPSPSGRGEKSSFNRAMLFRKGCVIMIEFLALLPPVYRLG
jgi:hypothetical protein